MPREPLANGGFSSNEPESASRSSFDTKAEVHLTPARTRVSYVMVLDKGALRESMSK